jgi:hypothetical protein
MTDTSIEIPDYVIVVAETVNRSMAELAGCAADLLTENSDLPAPVYFSVSEATQEVSLQFASTPDTFAALAEWAERFGANVTGCPHTHSTGQESVHCKVEFAHRGMNVELYAFVTATTADPATT